MCNGRVHAGFGHANMTQMKGNNKPNVYKAIQQKNDSLSDINGQQHAGFDHDNILQAKQTN
jgi:hypothetical protein